MRGELTAPADLRPVVDGFALKLSGQISLAA
jgi:hypothetical protein